MENNAAPARTNADLRVLYVDKQHARSSLVQLLQECQYQVQCVATSKQALQLLNTEESLCPFDIVIKDHDPSQAHAYRLLRLMTPHHLAKVPVILVSANYEREMVMKCLNLGAVDFLIKPLRRNEVQQIWTRLWWWRRQQASMCNGSVQPFSLEEASSSEGSQETECDNDDEPTSNEGSAPDNGNGSNANGSNGNGNSGNDQGSNGEDNTNSRIELKLHGDVYNCKGSSGNNGNSATKNIHQNWHGSNVGHGNLAERNALVNTAEGKAPPNSELPSCASHPHSPDGRKRQASAVLSEEARHLNNAVGAGKRIYLDVGRCKNEESVQANASASGQLSGRRHQGHAHHQTGHHQHQQFNNQQAGGQTRSGSSGGNGSSPKAASRNGDRARASGQPVGGSVGDAAAATNNASALGATNRSTHTLSEDTVYSAGGQQWPVGKGPAAAPAAAGAAAPGCAGNMSATSSHQHQHRSSQLGASAAPSQAASAAPAPAPAASSGAGPTLAPSPSESAPPQAPTRVIPQHPSAQLAAAQVQQQQQSAAAAASAAAASSMGALPQYRMMGNWGPQPGASCQSIPVAVQPPSAYAPPLAYQGFYPSVNPYGPMMGLPPHMMQQLNPAALQSLFASANMAHGRPGAMQGIDPMSAVSMEQMFSMQGMPMQYMPGQVLQPPMQQLPVHSASVAEWQAAQVLASQKAAAPPQQLYFFNHLGQPTAAVAQAAQQQQQQQQPKEAAATLASHHHHHHHHHAHAHAEPSPKDAHTHAHAQAHSLAQVQSAAPSAGLDRAGSLQATQSMHSMPRMSMVSEPGKRRALALEKYRLKRQKLKFGKVIRYESRKQLAQQRPRVKGQFVKHVQGGTEPSAGMATPEGTTGDEDCAGTKKRGYEGQNFEEVDGDGEDVSRSTENDSRTIDDEEGGGGSGTGTGARRGGQGGPRSGEMDCKVQAQQTGVSSPEEEEEDVVNSLRQLREGPPRPGGMI